MSTSAKFYPVVRFPSSSPFASDIGFLRKFYLLLIDVVAEASLRGAKRRSNPLELGVNSPFLLELLPELLDYAQSVNVELAIASASSIADLENLQSHLTGLNLSQPLKVFSPGLIMEYYEQANGLPDIDYVPAVYTRHDFNLLTQMASGVPLTMLKVFPATCRDASDLAEFMQGPFPEFKTESRRVLAVSKDLRERYLSKFTKVASPSDYILIRDLFISDKNMVIVLTEAEDIAAGDISGAELITYIASEFPNIEIVAAGLKNIDSISKLGARSYATAVFKLPLMRIASGFEMDNIDQALLELREEMIAELNSIYAKLPQYSSL